jgi:hypothetical protein
MSPATIRFGYGTAAVAETNPVASFWVVRGKNSNPIWVMNISCNTAAVPSAVKNHQLLVSQFCIDTLNKSAPIGWAVDLFLRPVGCLEFRARSF